jgi:hypothetical protein
MKKPRRTRTTNRPRKPVLPPAIGAVWKGQGGVYAGIVRGRDSGLVRTVIIYGNRPVDTVIVDGVEYVPLTEVEALRLEVPTLKDYHLIIGPEAPDRLSFDAAVKFCAAQSVDGHSDFTGMFRREQSVAFGNVPEHFRKTWYWSREQRESSADYVWGQDFGDGSQGYWRKDNTNRVRAVRRVAVGGRS